MLVLLLAVCSMPPQAPLVTLPPQSPTGLVTAVTCRCGDACPFKGECGDNCGCATPARPEGEGWQWDAREGVWWRYVTGPTPPNLRSNFSAPVTFSPSAGRFVPLRFNVPLTHTQAYSRGAASCST